MAVICALPSRSWCPAGRRPSPPRCRRATGLSMCSMPFTVVVRERSKRLVKRCSISPGGRPLYVQTTATTGMSISGRMSVGICSTSKTPITMMSMATTTKVYGRRRARLTIHMAGRQGASARGVPRCVGAGSARNAPGAARECEIRTCRPADSAVHAVSQAAIRRAVALATALHSVTDLAVRDGEARVTVTRSSTMAVSSGGGLPEMTERQARQARQARWSRWFGRRRAWPSRSSRRSRSPSPCSSPSARSPGAADVVIRGDGDKLLEDVFACLWNSEIARPGTRAGAARGDRGPERGRRLALPGSGRPRERRHGPQQRHSDHQRARLARRGHPARPSRAHRGDHLSSRADARARRAGAARAQTWRCGRTS